MNPPPAEPFEIFPFYRRRCSHRRSWFGRASRWMPAQFADELRFEWRMFKVRFRSKRRRRRFESMRDILLNVGCGRAGREGWVNLDGTNGDTVNCVWDARRSLPFADRSVRGLFCEHFLEHLEYTREVPLFLNECRRVMQAGAVARFIVPDAGRYLRAYAAGGWDQLAALRPLTGEHRDHWFGHAYHTPMELVNVVFRQGVEHQFAWDEDTLRHALSACGFESVKPRRFGESADPRLLIDTPERAGESLYVEAVRPGG